MSKNKTQLWKETLGLYAEMTRGYWWIPILFLVVNVASMSFYELVLPVFYKEIVDILTNTKDAQELLNSGLQAFWRIMIAIFIVLVIERITILVGNMKVERTYILIREKALEILHNHSSSFFTDNMSGSIINQFHQFWKGYVSLTNYFGGYIIRLIMNIVGILGTSYLVFKESTYLGYLFIGYAVSILLITTVWRHFMLPILAERQKTRNAISGLLTDIITNMTLVKAFSGETKEMYNYSVTEVNYEKVNRKMITHYFAQFTIQDLLFYILQGVLLYNVILEISAGTSSVGVFAMLWSISNTMRIRVNSLSQVIQNITETFSDAHDMTMHLLQEPDIKDIDKPLECSINAGNVVFSDVYFTYQNQGVEVFKGINISIPAGQKVGIIGHSGSGKSTFAKLLMRFLEPTNGVITIDNIDISKIKQTELRSKIAYVPQENSLFHRSILENLRYANTDKMDEEVMNIAKITYVDEFVNTLPNTYKTLVGERGLKLSGGQKQRVAIARAMLKDAPILLLDEATSALDSESEGYIQLGFDALMKDKTTIVIAHRLSTLLKMDRIIVMEDGTIREDDTLERLMNNEKSRFRQLWDNQKNGFISDTEEGKIA